MTRVVLPNPLVEKTGGPREIELQAANVRELLEQLEDRWPGSRTILDRCAVAIDGYICQKALLEPIERDGEVVFISRIVGG